MKHTLQTFTALAALFLGPALASAQDFPQWRGPNRDGVLEGFAVPTTWPKELKQQWQVTVGEGHSTPVVGQGKVYVLARQQEEEVVLCLDLNNGKLLWRQSYAAPYQVNPVAASHGKGPKSTPTLVEGKLFTFGISGILSCFDAATGAVRWRAEFSKKYKATSPLYGTALSPLVAKGMCIVHVGGHDQGALMAFDADTGRVKWSYEGDGPAYASPILATLAGESQIVTQTQENVVGVAAATGRLLWRVPFKTDYEQNIVTPVISGDLVIVSGYGQPPQALHVEKTGEQFQARQVWQAQAHAMYMSSPVLKDKLLFGMVHRGERLFCLDVETGKMLWEGEGRLGSNVALLRAADVLLLLTTKSKLIVARADGRKYEPLVEYKVAATPTWAHPVPVGRRILIKDSTTLTAWSLGEKGR